MKNAKTFVALKATDADCRAINAIREHLRRSTPWVTRSDVLRFALSIGVDAIERGAQ